MRGSMQGFMIGITLMMLVSSVCAATSGINPLCPYGCPGCLQKTAPASATTTVKVLTCPGTGTGLVRGMFFTPICTSAGVCDNVSMQLSFPGYQYNSDSHGCFRTADGSGSRVTSSSGATIVITVNVICQETRACNYASFIDLVCEDFVLGGQTVSATVAPATGVESFPRDAFTSTLKLASAGPACTSSSSWSTQGPYAQGTLWSFQTGTCSSGYPSLRSIGVESTDSLTHFRVLTSGGPDVSPTYSSLPLGSSNILTDNPVSCFNADYSTQPLTTTTMGRNMYVIVVCEATTCNFRWNIVSGGCTTVAPTQSAKQNIGCDERCSGDHYGTCDTSTAQCVCSASFGFTGNYCSIPPVTIPFATAAVAVDGGWTAWSACSASGTHSRTCTNPAPANGGAMCVGSSTEACTPVPPPVVSSTCTSLLTECSSGLSCYSNVCRVSITDVPSGTGNVCSYSQACPAGMQCDATYQRCLEAPIPGVPAVLCPADQSCQGTACMQYGSTSCACQCGNTYPPPTVATPTASSCSDCTVQCNALPACQSASITSTACSSTAGSSPTPSGATCSASQPPTQTACFTDAQCTDPSRPACYTNQCSAYNSALASSTGNTCQTTSDCYSTSQQCIDGACAAASSPPSGDVPGGTVPGGPEGAAPASDSKRTTVIIVAVVVIVAVLSAAVTGGVLLYRRKQRLALQQNGIKMTDIAGQQA